MSVITRADGAAFVVRCYRERFVQHGISQLKRDCRALANSHGHYLRAFKQAGQQWEVVFSYDSGYLLAESIWHHVGKIDNLLFCEEFQPGKIIVLIVKQGIIFFDAVLTPDQVLEELPSLMADQTVYHVKIAGNVPISNQLQPQSFYLPARQVLRFENSPDPVFALIKPVEKFRLLPVDYALAEIKPLQHSFALILGLALTLFVGWLTTRETPLPPMPTTPTPWQVASEFLATPAPTALLQAVDHSLVNGYAIPGWVVTGLHYRNGVSLLVLHSLGAPTSWVLDWAGNRHYAVDLTAQGAEVKIPLHLKSRQLTGLPLDSVKTISVLIDRLMQVIPGKSVQIHESRKLHWFRYTDLEIQLTELSPQVFDIIAQMMTGLAIQLQQVDLNVNNGLLSGTIKLTVIGS